VKADKIPGRLGRCHRASSEIANRTRSTLSAVGLQYPGHGTVIGKFKLNHPTVYNIDDAGGIMFGPIGREFLATCFCLYWLFVSGSAMLGVSIGLNAVSTHGTCTAVFVAIAAAIGLAFASVRTLGRMSWLAWIGTICVLVSSKGLPMIFRSIPTKTNFTFSLHPHNRYWCAGPPCGCS
jgi:hypothetical protein